MLHQKSEFAGDAKVAYTLLFLNNRGFEKGCYMGIGFTLLLLFVYKACGLYCGTKVYLTASIDYLCRFISNLSTCTRSFIIIFLGLSLFACNGVSILGVDDRQKKFSAIIRPVLDNNNIHYHVEQLAQQLFASSKGFHSNRSIAVGTLLPSAGIGAKTPMALNPMGHQIQESLVTIAAQLGLRVVEFKSTGIVTLKDNMDIMLTRHVNLLQNKVDIDYFLTGTYSEQEDSLVVNIRLIDVQTKNIVAAATGFIPSNVMWAQPVIMLNGSRGLY